MSNQAPLMFNFDKTSKKTKLALRFFTYGVMTIATIVITAISMLFALGYRFDRANLSFDQGGLLQLQTRPDGATVVIDGTKRSYNTPGKSDVTAGKHTISLQKKDYRAWSKTVPVAAGQLLWINYARLFPEAISTAPVQEFASLAGTLVSPDRKWLLAQTAIGSSEFIVSDLSDPPKPKIITLNIPDDKLTIKSGAVRAFSLLEWDQDSRYFLVRYTSDEITEYLRLDRSQPAGIINISRNLQLPISDIKFAGGNPNSVYIKNEAVLRRAEGCGIY